MVNAVNNSYGNIQRVATDANNRVVYRVIDSKGKDAGYMSVAQKDADTFEKSYIDVMSTAPKIQEYVANNSQPEDIDRRRNISRICTGLGGAIGASIPLLVMKKAGTAKKVVSSIIAAIAGIAAGFGASLAITTPPGAFKFARATRTLSGIDIQPVDIKELGGGLKATHM